MKGWYPATLNEADIQTQILKHLPIHAVSKTKFHFHQTNFDLNGHELMNTILFVQVPRRYMGSLAKVVVTHQESQYVNHKTSILKFYEISLEPPYRLSTMVPISLNNYRYGDITSELISSKLVKEVKRQTTQLRFFFPMNEAPFFVLQILLNSKEAFQEVTAISFSPIKFSIIEKAKKFQINAIDKKTERAKENQIRIQSLQLNKKKRKIDQDNETENESSGLTSDTNNLQINNQRIEGTFKTNSRSPGGPTNGVSNKTYQPYQFPIFIKTSYTKCHTITTDTKLSDIILHHPNSYYTHHGKILNPFTHLHSQGIKPNDTIRQHTRLRGGSITTTHQPTNTETENTPQANIHIGCLNTQSLKADLITKPLLAEFIIQSQFDFFGITETWTDTNNNLTRWTDKSLHGMYNIISDHKPNSFKSYNYNGKGTAIIYNKIWEPYIHKRHRSEGRFTGIELKRLNETILIGCIYFPANKSHVDEILILTKYVKDIISALPKNAKIILMGDWNDCNNPALDKISNNITLHSETKPNRTTPKTVLLKWLTNPFINLIDVYRNLYPNRNEYTHTCNKKSQNNEHVRTQSRIDFFLISSNLLHRTIHTTIQDNPINHPTNRLHHKLITLELTIPLNKLQIHKEYHKELITLFDYTKEENREKYNEKLQNDTRINNMIKSINQYEYHDNETTQEYLENCIDNLSTTIQDITLSTFPKSTYLRETGRFDRNPKQSNLQKQIYNTCKKLKNINREETEKLHEKWSTRTKTVQETPISEINTDDLKKNIHTMLQLHIKNKLKSNKTKSQLFFRKKIVKNIPRFLNYALERKNNFQGLYFIQKPTNNSTNNNEDKEFTSNPQKVKNIIRDYYQNLFKQDEPISLNPEWTRYFSKQTEYSEAMKTMTKSISMEELIQAKQKLGNNKAPGPDKITYEQIRHISSPRVLTILLFIFNECLNRCIFPTNANKATIILLSKLPQFNGDPNKLRPITLLTTFRKLFTRIINTRLQNIIETNNILKGNNFGFRPGKSTNNYLSILRNIIDHAKQTDNRLYIALLDIQKAYDTVPNEALRLCLNRIAVPKKIIDLIVYMQSTRTIQINTPYGPTTPFTPDRGLPQGDVISCILWNIFYDTLLHGYQISPTIQITELAYADDLIPITDNEEAMQHLLNMIHSYLSQFHMNMNANKSSIITNQPITDIETSFTLGNVPLKDIKSQNELFRILGVYITLDGNHTKTIQHATTWLDKILTKIRTKFTPGPLMRYLTNAVIIPTLEYRLQTSVVTPSQHCSINRKIRKTVRSKYKIDTTIPNSNQTA